MGSVAINAAAGPAIATDQGTRDGVVENVQIVRQDYTLLATYGASYTALAGVSGLLFTLTGNASKVVKLRRLMVSGIATTAAAFDLTLVKYSTVATGGTAVTAAIVAPFDSNNGSASSAVAAYSVAPTAGTSAGILMSKKLQLLAAATQSFPIDMSFGEEFEQCPTLRSATQQFGVLLSAAPTGGSIDVSAWWTEESNSF